MLDSFTLRPFSCFAQARAPEAWSALCSPRRVTGWGLSVHGVTGQSSLGPGTVRYPTKRGLQEKAVQGVDLKIKLPVIFY